MSKNPTHGQSKENNELHFLVTHWLSNYKIPVENDFAIDAILDVKSGPKNQQDVYMKPKHNDEKQRIVKRIHEISAELADAFHSLGAYGNTIENPLKESTSLLTGRNRILFRPASYVDVVNRWSHVPPSQLEHIAKSSTNASNAAINVAREKINHNSPISIIDVAYENHLEHNILQASNSVNVDEMKSNRDENNSNQYPHSILHPSSLLLPESFSSTLLQHSCISALSSSQQINDFISNNSENNLSLSEGSDLSKLIVFTAAVSRNELQTRDKLMKKQRFFKTIQKSLISQQNEENELLKQQMNHTTLSSSKQPIDWSEHQSKKLECERVISQLSRNIVDIQKELINLQTEYDSIVTYATELRKHTSLRLSSFCDPSTYSIYVSNHNIPMSTLPYSSPIFLDNKKPNYSPEIMNKKHHLRKKRNFRSSMLGNILSRQYTGRVGGDGRLITRSNNSIGKLLTRPKQLNSTYKSIMMQRMSHSITINCHLVYPVYCLCFDQTGKYFVTGADDHLVKLFYLGGATSMSSCTKFISSRSPWQYDVNPRGAILISTLRGHAGVITDIDISADNTLLATASEDGSCRIWGLHDGCPVAVLRGHVGGANMVSWSTLTPFRLVTSSMDGLARMWDIREAALKRYVTMTGKRSDYLLPFSSSKLKTNNNAVRDANFTNSSLTRPNIPNANRIPFDSSQSENTNQRRNIVVPPLPQGDHPLNVDNQLTSAQAVVEANNEERYDEGVRLLSKLQHGEMLVSGRQYQNQGPGTRSRRKTVKVICLARCPVGGHFATGSDDGLGRIWADSEDPRVEEMDSKMKNPFQSNHKTLSLPLHDEGAQNEITPSTDTLLATLPGHLNPITDIAYSHGGDRILTASQKDGVLRIWAWGKDSRLNFKTKRETKLATGKNGGFGGLTQILICLTGFSDMKNGANMKEQTRRRSGSRRSAASSKDGSNVQCDVAVWSSDDEKVITSQTISSKASTNEILPGSHIIYVWHSHTGKCLLGIIGSHNSPCPVLAVHPYDSSILASAGADGCLHIWDLNCAESFFYHKNILKYGPCEAGSKDKTCGFLDGAFSPDGLSLVLTDDAGRITIIDSFNGVKRQNDSETKSKEVSELELRQDGIQVNGENPDLVEPWGAKYNSIDKLLPWMKEQYFANDYYDVDYDDHGYAIERGSRAPPHLAPRASRCNHTGTAVPDQINIRFGKMKGPLPLSQEECRWKRESIRSQMNFLKMNNCEALDRNVREKRAVSIAQSGGATQRINFTKPDEMVLDLPTSNITQTETGVFPTMRSTSSSNNNRYMGYEDIDLVETDERDTEEANDEDFIVSSTRNSAQSFSSDEDIDELDNDIYNELEDTPPSSPARNSTNQRRGGSRNLSSSSTTTDREDRLRQRNLNQHERVEVEESNTAQPSRLSSRRAAREATSYKEYDEVSVPEEFLSKNTKCPANHPFEKDFSGLGHIWKLTGNEKVQRMWLCREESQSGYIGSKPYAPQVGDSVIYIPRAHYDTLETFPGIPYVPPWTTFPRNNSWPVIQCTIMNIRFRFPYENYFRKNSGSSCVSIVAIVTLRITGVPKNSSHDFPWPDPEFMTFESMDCVPTSVANYEFEVSVFQNDELEFLIPEHLYQFRVRNLENLLLKNKRDLNEVKLSSYFITQDNNEDCVMKLGICTIMNISDTDEESEPHFQKSGYKCIMVQWENKEVDMLSPWELNVQEQMNENKNWPSLSQCEKKHYSKVLAELKKEAMFQHFQKMPDCSMYVDYLDCIEVPMYLSRIKKRIQSYYANRESLFADINLIIENCRKYNKEHVDLFEAADLLKATFFEISDGIDFGFHADEASRLSKLSPTGKKRGESITSTESLVENLTSASPVMEGVSFQINKAESSSNDSVNSEIRVTQEETKNDVDLLANSSSLASTGMCTRSKKFPPKKYSHHNDIVQPFRESDATLCALQTSFSEENMNNSKANDVSNVSNVSNKKNGQAQKENDGNEATALIVTRLRSKTKECAHNVSEPKSSIPNGRIRNSNRSQNIRTRSSSRIKKSEKMKSDDDFFVSGSSSCEESFLTKPYSVSSAMDSSDEGEYGICDESEIQSISSKTDTMTPALPKYDIEDQTTPPRRISKRIRKHSKKKQDIFIEDESSSEGYTPKPSKRKVRQIKRKTKKAKVKRTEDENFFPALQKWPQPTEKEEVQRIARIIINKLQNMDVKKIFHRPVIKTYPKLSGSYLSIIEKPMDFETIENKRLEGYEVIADLQEDLELIFKNCCRFNNEKSFPFKYAMKFWKGLKDIYKETCEGEDIMLPRRF